MTTDRNAVISQLKDSLELRLAATNVLVSSFILYIFLVLAAVSEDITGVESMFILALLSVVGFYLRRIFRIFRKPEQYIFCECILNQPNWQYRTFTVRVEMPDGEIRHVNTHAIFIDGGLTYLPMKDYVNQTVTIGYNPKTGMVVVIG